MELIQRHKQLVMKSKYKDFIFFNDYGVLRRSDYREHKSIYVEWCVKDVKYIEDTLIVLKHERELIFEEINMSTLKKTILIQSSDFESLFNDPKNAYENCVIDYEYDEGILTCIFKEDSRRFVAKINLITADMETVAEWQVQ